MRLIDRVVLRPHPAVLMLTPGSAAQGPLQVLREPDSLSGIPSQQWAKCLTHWPLPPAQCRIYFVVHVDDTKASLM